MFNILLFFAYLIRTIRNVLYQLFWWELKEYRFDRMIVHLKETDQGFRLIFNPISIVKWIILVMFFFNFELVAAEATFLVYFLEGLKNIYEFKIGWKMPPLRSRVIAVGIVSIIILLFIFTQLPFIFPVNLIIVDKLLAIVIAFLVLTSNVLFNFYKNIKINKAKDKVQKANNLKVIGVTGSYGKTTTKELIAQLLSKKYKVLKTIGSQNTDIGIAERILSVNLEDYDYFVCEMAAYKIGEIKNICKIFGNKIEIGVITGINQQHQSLFGNLKNTQKAKFELIETIPKNGTAIFNGKSKYIEEMISWANNRNLKVIVDKASISNLPTFTQNLSLAKNVAKIIGMNENEIEYGIKKVQLPDKTMNVIKKGNLFLIDNTFNSNPDGVYAALSYLKDFKGNKILVLQPLIELGKYTEEVHRKIGKMADQICTQIVLTNRNFFKYINQEIKEKNKISVGKLNKIISGAILFQGKEAEKYLKQYKKI